MGVRALLNMVVITMVAALLGWPMLTRAEGPKHKVGDKILEVTGTGFMVAEPKRSCPSGKTFVRTSHRNPDTFATVPPYGWSDGKVWRIATDDASDWPSLPTTPYAGAHVLYGDQDGKGLITVIGTPGDSVFGNDPCHFIDSLK